MVKFNELPRSKHRENYNNFNYKTGDLSLDKFISARNGYVLYLEEKFVNQTQELLVFLYLENLATTVHIVFLLIDLEQ